CHLLSMRGKNWPEILIGGGTKNRRDYSVRPSGVGDFYPMPLAESFLASDAPMLPAPTMLIIMRFPSVRMRRRYSEAG
ncbi:hypothetical protein, partial [Dickeya dianthicola]